MEYSLYIFILFNFFVNILIQVHAILFLQNDFMIQMVKHLKLLKCL